MDFSELLLKRRSIRKFQPERVKPEDIELLKRAALLSPTGKRKNHWDFIFVEEKETLKKLALCKPHGARLIENSALAVVVIGDPEVSDTWIEDCSIASIILQYQAQELGLGSCWVQVDKREHSQGKPSGEYIKPLLNIPETKKVLSVIAIGHPAEKRDPAEEKDLLWGRIHSEVF
ncbi:MAG: nitroreductase family protein [Prolixibacteraceae bacterium]|nr:nitroreductase family protein [Prolixibacteraceae bacterium]